MNTNKILLAMLALSAVSGLAYFATRKDEKKELLMLVELDKTDSAGAKEKTIEAINKMDKQEISDTYKWLKSVINYDTRKIEQLKKNTTFKYRLDKLSKKYKIFDYADSKEEIPEIPKAQTSEFGKNTFPNKPTSEFGQNSFQKPAPKAGVGYISI